jgi:hypothetical protein
MRSSTLDLDKSTSNSQEKRYAVTLIVTLFMSSQRSPALGGDVDHPTIKRTNPDGMSGKMKNLKKLKSLKHLRKKNLLRQNQAHRPNIYGKRRQHHHPHKRSSHLSLHHRDQIMHLKSKYSLLPSPV